MLSALHFIVMCMQWTFNETSAHIYKVHELKSALRRTIWFIPFLNIELPQYGIMLWGAYANSRDSTMQ